MAVHHFTAADLKTSAPWQPIETIPHDGTVVEVQDQAGNVATAHWQDEWLTVGRSIGIPTHWRQQQED